MPELVIAEPTDPQVAAVTMPAVQDASAAASQAASSATTQQIESSAVQTQPAAQPVQAAATPAWSAREHLRSLGVDPSPFHDDKSVLDYLISQYQQVQPLVQYGRKYAQHASAFEEWQRQQSQQAAPVQQTPAQKTGWNAPAYDASWQYQVVFDPAARAWVSAQGVDPSIGQKYTAFRKHQEEFNASMAQKGPAFFQDEIKRIAGEQAQELIRAHLAQYKTSSYISDFESQNSAWLYQHDAGGNMLRGFDGEPAFTPEGARFHQHIEVANRLGIADPRAKEQYAKNMLLSDISRVKAMSSPAGAAPAANEQHKAALLAAGRQPNHSGTLAPASNPTIGAPTQNGKLNLRQMLAAGFKENGITDEAIMAGTDR